MDHNYRSMDSEKQDENPIGCLMIPASIFIVPAVILGIWKIFFYLRNGEWIEVSTLEALHLIGVDWATNPHSWLGVHKILSGLSLFDFLGWSGLTLMIPLFLYLLGNKP